MAATRDIRAIISGSSESAVRAFEETAAASDAAGDAIDDKFGGVTDKTGNVFDKLGEKMESLGLPFGSVFTKMGAKIDEADTKGKKMFASMAEWGKVGLASVAVGGAAVIGESLHLADEFEPVHAALETAVKNSGTAWKTISGQIAAADTTAAHFGFTMSDTEDALQELTTATNSPKKALADMTEVENLAAMKHMSLASAATVLTKVYGGSTRALAQLGINVDIGTGKLASIRTATESVTTAQIHLQQAGVKTSEVEKNLALIRQEITDKQLKGTTAASSLISAQDAVTSAEQSQTNAARTLSLAHEKLAYDQGTVAKILKTVADRTNGAAAAYGKTFTGEIHVAGAELSNFGTTLGLEVIPWVDRLIGLGTKVVGFFEHNKDAAIALAAIIGGPLAVTIGAFIVTKVDSLINKTQMLGSRLLGIGKDAEETSDPIAELSAALKAQNEQFSALAGAIGKNSLGLSDLKGLTAEQTEALEKLSSETEVASESFDALIASANEMAGALEAGEAEMASITADLDALGVSAEAAGDTISASMEAAAATTDAAAADMDEAIGSTGFGAILIALGMVVMLLLQHWKFVWSHVKEYALDAWHWFDGLIHNSWFRTITEMILPFTWFLFHWKETWGFIKAAAVDVWHFLDNDILHPMETAFEDTWHVIDDVFVKPELLGLKLLKDAFIDAWHFIDTVFIHPAETAFHLLEHGIDDVVGAVGKITHIGSSVLHAGGDLNPVNWFAEGGIVTRKAVVGVAEHEPEAIIPLSHIPHMFDSGAGVRPLPTMSGSGTSSNSQGMHVDEMNINITTTEQDGNQIAASLCRGLRARGFTWR